MSTCISIHGEYSNHTPDSRYGCTRCYVLDEDALFAEVDRLRAELTLVKERLQGSREHVEEEHRKVVGYSAEIRKLLDERDSRQAALNAIPKPSNARLTVRVLDDGHVCLTMPMRHAQVLTGYLAEPVVAAKYPRTDDVPSDIWYTLNGVGSLTPEPPSTPDTAAGTETIELVYCPNCPRVAMPITGGQASERKATQGSEARSPEGASRVCLHSNTCVGIPRFGSVMCAEHDNLPPITPPGEVDRG